MRNAIVMDSDGSVMYNKVKLTPSNWYEVHKSSVRELISSIQGLDSTEKNASRECR